MLKFPEHIDIHNKTLVSDDFLYETNFSKYNYQRLEEIFRKDVYEMIISRKDENDYFDLDSFVRNYNCNSNDKNIKLILSKIISELNRLGWKTALSFGDTGLFIYSTEKKPSSCW